MIPLNDKSWPPETRGLRVGKAVHNMYYRDTYKGSDERAQLIALGVEFKPGDEKEHEEDNTSSDDSDSDSDSDSGSDSDSDSDSDTDRKNADKA